ncbi:GNAT family N-acetyltransferase [Candidatus Protofrankia californiensis]|uniref:GNAT family N-acetyltransferase n=1 Tax=Candidatus Protofrankia californiensis TaxID=1839754 RepID=UPI001040F28C|nr:GNAT family N-acetyltransferase [Candidatus Protofrankia californiensis]
MGIDRVTLRPLGEELLQALLAAAVADADPREVMPPVEGPSGWTALRRQAFLRFHRLRSLSDEPVETTYAIVVRETVVGAARLAPHKETDTVEAGVWIGRSLRGCGVGAAVLRHLLEAARADGAQRLVASTHIDNIPAQRLLTAAGGDLSQHDATTVIAWVPLQSPWGSPS